MARRTTLRSQTDCMLQFRFTRVQVLEQEPLGQGSYGAVYKAKCDELICAAKKIFPVLFQQGPSEPGREHAHPLRRFESECELLKSIDHPNIVQYLGTYHDPVTNTLVLLMELMDESLTHFLESSPGDLPYHTQVNFSHDIAQALAFLHSNGIIHRDLSSNNVLLLAGARAKVTDFGMSRLLGVNNKQMTKCPGTPAFMPPEALEEKPEYSEKIDNFSFGVLIVQIITREYPDPTGQYVEIPIENPQYPLLPVRSLVPEIERRKEHISLIAPTHSLLPIATDCLNDIDTKRPTSQELCTNLRALKETPAYEASAQEHSLRSKNEHIVAQNLEIQKKDELIYEKNDEIKHKDKQIEIKEQDLVIKIGQLQQKEELVESQKDQLEAKDNTIETLTTQLQEALTENGRQSTQLQALNQQLEKIVPEQQQISDRTIRNPEKALKQNQSQEKLENDTQEPSQPAKEIPNNVPLCSITVQGATSTPPDILPTSSALIGNNVYFTSKSKKTVHQYDTTNKQWSEIKDHPLNCGFSITNVQNHLTTIGGETLTSYSNKIYSYPHKKWVEMFPPMTTKRCSPAVIFVEDNLIVIGGDNCKLHNSVQYSVGSVEVMNIETLQWQGLTPLPQPYNELPPLSQLHLETTLYSKISAAIQSDCIYVTAHIATHIFEVRMEIFASVPGAMQYKCSLSNLLRRYENPKWEQNHLFYNLQCITSANEHLLAVTSPHTIYEYDTQNDSWEPVGEMSVARSSCTATLLPDNVLMITGLESDKCSADFIRI